ncbi:relaxase/mobilization nuclease domain-containing protein [Chroococcus sp. FPU101]|uniref:relaxase/mobilization nuclease domain-containing protein n=1 Tax=Chroococcus sp. FPU101 TaxID=1974212 RepID=UPI001A8DBF24|nr:relaxase/mobilization nuclease domain-containing protein [Chroococcus sp. FPU101]GFE69108.1 hypothetical protein CFPU101_17180 [Chroococcus sp. FPU101]
MIGKVTLQSKFKACLNYILSKPNCRIIYQNLLIGNKADLLAEEFEFISSSNSRIKKPCLHLSLNPHPEDQNKLIEQSKIKFATSLLESLSMENCQWIMVEHYDAVTDNTIRPHLHLIINRIPINSEKAINHNFIREIEKNLHELRKEYNLKPIIPSREVEQKHYTNSEYQKIFKRGFEPKSSIIKQFQTLLEPIINLNISVDEKLSLLEKQEIKIIPYKKGYCYQHKNQLIGINRLGRRYSPDNWNNSPQKTEQNEI